MKKSLISCFVVVLLFALITQFLYAKDQSDSTNSKTRILVEATTLQISNEVLAKLNLENEDPASNVKVSFPILLHALGDPDAIKILTSAKLVAHDGEMVEVENKENVKYITQVGQGTFDQEYNKETFRTILKAKPNVDKLGHVLLNFTFDYNVPIMSEIIKQGKPIGHQASINSVIKVKSGEPVLVSNSMMSNSKSFTVVYCEIIE